MKKTLYILLFSLASFTSLTSALPPLYQSMAEYKALMDDPHLSKHLNSAESIKEITRENGVFTITTNLTTLKAKVIYDPMDKMGPAKFHFEFETQKTP